MRQQMNVLVLRSSDADLPKFSSFEWISVEKEALTNCSLYDARDMLHRIFVASQPVLVLSLGNRQIWVDAGVATMPLQFRNMWTHADDIALLTEDFLTTVFLRKATQEDCFQEPLISVITSSYRSEDKIQRAYESLLGQSYDNWEWVIWDDSPDDETYGMLQGMAAKDLRLKIYKAPQRSGSIGEMKFRASSLAEGKWLVELDHDDRLAPHVFEWVRDIAVARPATKFIYSDHAEIHEDQDSPHTYGEYYGFCFASYMRQHLRTHPKGPLQPQYISRSSWLHPITLHHLIGLPNHVRIWNKAFYEAVGRHRVWLPVADDYDLLLRTFLEAQPGEIVCIAFPSYFQYRNSGANNFTFKRNSLIQHLVKHLYRAFNDRLIQKYQALGWSSDYHHPGKGIWETTLMDVRPRMEYYFVPEDQNPENPCISIVMPIACCENVSTRVHRAVQLAVRQTHQNWKLYFIGDGCTELDRIASEEFPKHFLDHLSKIAWYNLGRAHDDQGRTAKNYALRMLVKTRWVTYMEVGNNAENEIWGSQHLSSLLQSCISAATSFCHQSLNEQNARGFNKSASTLLHTVELAEENGFWGHETIFETIITSTSHLGASITTSS